MFFLFYLKSHLLILFNYIFNTEIQMFFLENLYKFFIDLKNNEISEESKLKNNFNKEKNEINNESQMVQLKARVK